MKVNDFSLHRWRAKRHAIRVPRPWGLARVLRKILSVGDVPRLQALQQNVGGLGDEEVQTAEGPQDTGEQVSRTAFREEAVSLCALAERHGRCVCLMGAV